MNDGEDLFTAGWRWCSNNAHWYHAPQGVPPEAETACVGCGQPAPPPVPCPYPVRLERHPYA